MKWKVVCDICDGKLVWQEEFDENTLAGLFHIVGLCFIIAAHIVKEHEEKYKKNFKIKRVDRPNNVAELHIQPEVKA